MRKREIFDILEFGKRYDEKTGTFRINIHYRTRTEITPRTIAVAEAFGLGVDEHQEHVVYDNVELKISPKDIVLVTGESGSGKSVLLRALVKDLGDQAINMADIGVDSDRPLIDTVGKNLEEGLELLSRVGLNDAFLFVRRYSQLSDGQKYRYQIAKTIESGRQYWVMDEFCSTLDRDTAKIVSFNVQKLARKSGKAVLVATTHTDLLEDLKPSVHIHKRFGKEIEVKYFPNKINKTCSLIREMYVAEGSREDYEKLGQFHYREAKGLVATQKIFALKRGEETVGVIVYKYPAITTFGRSKAFGRKLSLEEINTDLALISRVIVHPKYRTIGLGTKLVKETLPLVDKPYVEMIAVMAKYNPFAEKAGMKKIAESKPNLRLVEAVERLRKLGFNPLFLTSETTNLKKLRGMSPREVGEVRNVFKGISRGIYGRRLLSIYQAFLTKEDFVARVESASLEKLAKMLRILGFLTQTKVYLFWKNLSVGRKC